MTNDELYNFALDVVTGYESQNGAEIVDANPAWESYPSIVCKINGELSFILVEVAVAPKMPALSEERKRMLLAHAEKFKAKCYHASVGFGVCDAKRFDKSLALRGDEFYANYLGLEEI